jgi:hypothetical protein
MGAPSATFAIPYVPYSAICAVGVFAVTLARGPYKVELLSLFWWNVIQRECVSFYQKLDCIEDLEKSGTEITFYIANHAPVFIVRGLHRKWKQPVAYCLNRGSSKANILVKFLNWVLSAHQNAGLHVIVTILTWVQTLSQGLEPVVCYQTEAILQVPESRYCDSMMLYTWSASETCSWNTMCSFSLSLCATIS